MSHSIPHFLKEAFQGAVRVALKAVLQEIRRIPLQGPPINGSCWCCCHVCCCIVLFVEGRRRERSLRSLSSVFTRAAMSQLKTHCLRVSRLGVCVFFFVFGKTSQHHATPRVAGCGGASGMVQCDQRPTRSCAALQWLRLSPVAIQGPRKSPEEIQASALCPSAD